jgi:hypothetical protein
MSYYTIYPEFSDQMQHEWATFDTHDQRQNQ